MLFFYKLKIFQVEDPPKKVEKEVTSNEDKTKAKTSIPSILVSLPLPYTGILQHKVNVAENRNVETSSVESMHEELCYFQPIEATTPTRYVFEVLISH